MDSVLDLPLSGDAPVAPPDAGTVPELAASWRAVCAWLHAVALQRRGNVRSRSGGCSALPGLAC